MEAFNEERLAEVLRAAGHDVFYGSCAGSDGESWCCWRTDSGDVPVVISADDDWPFEIYGPDPRSTALGMANSYDEAVALLAPLLGGA